MDHSIGRPEHDHLFTILAQLTAVQGSARTIDDLGGSEQIQAKHIAEALQYRSLDREY